MTDILRDTEQEWFEETFNPERARARYESMGYLPDAVDRLVTSISVIYQVCTDPAQARRVIAQLEEEMGHSIEEEDL